MRHRDDRDVHPGESADLPCVHSAGVDDDLGLDLSSIRFDRLRAAPRNPDPGHACRGIDLGASPARALSERERELTRIDVAVGRKKGSPEHAFGLERREELLRLSRRDQLERKAERLCPSCLACDLVHPRRCGGEAERADLVPARLEAHLALQIPVELDRAHHHLR